MELVYPNESRLFKIAVVLSTLVWLVLVVATVGIALVYILAIFVFALFVQAGFITYVKGNGVLVTNEQFPDIHARLLECARKVDLEEVPDTYLLRTDFFNALATRFLRRHYVVLFTDVVDALADRPGALNFYIGHELGHIHRNHIFWSWILAPALVLPLLGSAFRRAEEYTCDRYGNACCESEDDVTTAMAAIVAGNHRWKTMNVPAYLKQVEGTGGFWMSLNELTGEYPWLSKRMAWVVALRDGDTPQFPRRNFFAWLLSCFVPSVPGGMGSLIVVIAIIGILAAVALPAYQDYMKAVEATRSQDARTAESPLAYGEHMTRENLGKVLDEMSVLRGQVEEYHRNNDSYPTSLVQLGWESEVLVSENGGMPTAIYDDGILAVNFGEGPGGAVYFVNEPAIQEDGTLKWYCYGQNMPTEVLPEPCR
jgi:Zn-dependent protease with chaperone function